MYGSQDMLTSSRFLLARLHIQQIQELASRGTTKEKLKVALLSMPKTLSAIYQQSMQRIEKLLPGDRQLAKDALAWLAFAERPLKGAELQHAVGIEEGASKFDKSNTPHIEDIVEVCWPFVTHRKMDDILSLVHTTVSEFLKSSVHEWLPNAKEMLAKGCLSYLALDSFESGFCSSDDEFGSRLEQFPFYHYAARYWGNHLHEIPSLPEKEIRSSLMSQSKVASANQAMLIPEDESLQDGYSQRAITQTTGLHLAAYFGLAPVIKLLLAEGQKPALKDSQGRTALWRATEYNHEEVMKLLCDVDRTTLTEMLTGQEISLATSLLQIAGPSIKDARLRTALHIGVLHDNSDFMERAFRCGVDINSKDGDGNTPIQLALQEKKTRAMDWLLQKSAETAEITAEDWLQVYRRPRSDIVELSEDKSGQKKVSFLTLAQFKTETAVCSEKWRRLL